MADTLPVTFTNQNTSFYLKPSSPDNLPISLADAIKGEKGIDGAGTTFTWTQSIALPVWTIPHNLARFPSITVVDTLNNKVEPDIKYIDNNIIQVTHGSAYSGKAYIN